MRSGSHDTALNTVIGRAVRVLAAFSRTDQSVGISELARRTELPKSTTYRLVVELVRQNLLERVDDGFRPTVRLFEMGNVAPVPRELYQSALGPLRELSYAVQGTANVAVLDGPDVIYLLIVPARRTPPLPSRIGGRIPAHLTALGKAILAYSDARVVEQLLGEVEPALSSRRGMPKRQLLDQLDKTRAYGTAYDIGEIRPGIVCAASPVFDAGGQVLAAVSASGWPGQIGRSRVESAVKSAAAEVTRALRQTTLPHS